MYSVYAIKASNSSSNATYTRYLMYLDSAPNLSKTKVLDPKLTMQDNAAGAFTCKIPKGNSVYNTIEPMITYLEIYRDDTWLWTGRVLTIKRDFYLNKEITAEGALSYFNDVSVPLRKWESISADDYVRGLLNIYNLNAPEIRKIYLNYMSIVTDSGSPIGFRDYVATGESVMKHLSTLVEDWGMHMIIERGTRGNYKDKLLLTIVPDSELETSEQDIDFGKNLLDYIDEKDWTDLVTVIHPYGKELDTSTSTGDDEHPDRLTIRGQSTSNANFSVYDGEYLGNTSAVNKFGRIEETVEWSEVDDPATLMSLAELYLADYQYYNIKLTVKTVDLHYINPKIDGFKLLSKVICTSKIHDVHDEFIIDRMEIPFDKPEQTTFTFARSTMGYYTSDRPTQGFGRGTVSGMAFNINQFSKAQVLSEAKRNADNMIKSNLHGYVSLNMDEDEDHIEYISITNRRTQDTSTQMWTWSRGGLEYQSRSSINSDWNEPTVAITMDGQIVANRITTGQFIVADIQGGYLMSADFDSREVHIAGFTVKDDALYTLNKSTLASDSYGVYVGTDGISTSSGISYMALADGGLIGYNNGNSGYIQFSTHEITTGEYGLRIGGQGFIALSTGWNGWIGVSPGTWVSRDSNYYDYRAGCTGTILVKLNDPNDNNWYTITFQHGLMVTQI